MLHAFDKIGSVETSIGSFNFDGDAWLQFGVAAHLSARCCKGARSLIEEGSGERLRFGNRRESVIDVNVEDIGSVEPLGRSHARLLSARLGSGIGTFGLADDLPLLLRVPTPDHNFCDLAGARHAGTEL